ncbi:MAG: N-acetylmuramoyl-L-alanine amidase [Candidatus Gastranaerophilales bacterium]|nr:N-acetylmuramoyl-L-alanine amidase [Candidatus Gastranaerophilales bacterium]
MCEIFANEAVAEEYLKINSINFDNSDSIIFLGTSGTILTNFKITKKTLTEPDRVFFDIENAAITFPNSTFEIKNSKLEKVRIAQNSINPNIVRIVIWNSPDYDTSKIKVLTIKNNIIIKLNDEIPTQKYLTQTYRETKESAADYYDKTIIIPPDTTANKKESDEIFNKVQQAFKEEENQLVRPNIEQKQAKLKSRYFLEKISISNGNLVISGIGVINIAKPFTLTNPSRIIFDLPNTIVHQDLRDKEFKLTETSSVKIGQFEPSTARIVIKASNPESYIPIYSSNLQTLLFADETNLSSIKLNGDYSELTYFKEQNVNSKTDVINITFSTPVFYSLKREKEKINVIFYNLIKFDINSFNELAKSNKNGFEAVQLSNNVYKLTFPVKPDSYVDCYETLNAKQLRFIFTKTTVKAPTEPQEKKDKTVSIPIKTPEQMKKDKKIKPFSKKTTAGESAELRKIKNKVIIIDPGHGGNDTGAMRGKILEKDITLQIALKVKEILEAKGFTNVIMTRTSDKTLTLAERVETANSHNADIYVSIHINASVKNEIHGIETHYYWDRGYSLAKILHNELMSKVSAMDRGLFKSKFYVINHTEAPAVLLELGFISNEQERCSLISDKRQTDSAQAIADGIIKYLMEQ